MFKGLGCFKFAPHGFCIVALCRGKLNDRDFYAFVAIEPQNYAYFKKRYREGELSNFNAFGFELFRGWGTTPSEPVIEHVRLKHGIEFGVSENFLDQIAANNSALAAVPVSRSWYESRASNSQL